MSQLLDFNIFNPEIDWSTIISKDFEIVLDKSLPHVHKEFEERLIGDLDYYTLFSPEKTPHTSRLNVCYDFLCMLNNVKKQDDLIAIQKRYLIEFERITRQQLIDERMYHRILAFTFSSEYKNLSEEKKHFINTIALRNYETTGLQNESEDKNYLIQLTLEINEQKQIFENNLYNSQANINANISSKHFSGLPNHVVDSIQSLPFHLDLNNDKIYNIPYTTGLFWEIITYADESIVRNNFYQAQLKIGRHKKFNNTPIAQTIVNLLHQKAQILGFQDPAEILMAGNMFKKPEEVLNIFESLLSTTTKKYDLENNIYQNFARKILNIEPTLANREYILNKYEIKNFHVEHSIIEQYLQEKNILQGFKNVFGELFDINFTITKGEKVWHKDVFHMKVFDRHLGNKLGEIYLDLYSRPFKHNAGFCNDLIRRQTLADGSTSTPIVYITCNFSNNSENPTWSFTNLKTFFHEMGHAFNHIFSKTTVAHFSGTNNVQNDATELPSILFEKFCYDPQILKSISSHVVTKEPLPDSHIEALIKSQNFMKATWIYHHALISTLDFEIFSNKKQNIEEIEKRLIKNYINYTDDFDELIKTPSLHHIFTTGYSAGMYVYMWASILASDIYNDFKLAGDTYLEQKSIAKKFREIILSVGGSKDMLQQYILLKGRSPSIEPFLKEYELNQNISNNILI